MEKKEHPRTSIYTAEGSFMGDTLRQAAEAMGIDTSAHGWAQQVVRRALLFFLAHHRPADREPVQVAHNAEKSK